LIGYTSNAWIIRNQWGKDWGINGDMLLTMNNTYSAHCNMDYAAYSIEIP